MYWNMAFSNEKSKLLSLLIKIFSLMPAYYINTKI